MIVASIGWLWHLCERRLEERVRHERLIVAARLRCGCWVCELGWGP